MDGELKRLIAAQRAEMARDAAQEEFDSSELHEEQIPDLLVSQSGLWDQLD
jgi:hypothetical protein